MNISVYIVLYCIIFIIWAIASFKSYKCEKIKDIIIMWCAVAALYILWINYMITTFN